MTLGAHIDKFFLILCPNPNHRAFKKKQNGQFPHTHCLQASMQPGDGAVNKALPLSHHSLSYIK